ncbi:MAG TPA: CDP-diacylglycerol--glycerol-3-phosphate 3-phosphatidyltransferase [Rhizomicrobium sp.]|nr:CDP-diacylglycerol--glycerol-3-phosphate 3-phosphatidyltransferase [Rhizomicrobium sp.]
MLRLPNALTVLRILLVPVFALALMVPGETGRLSAFVIFCVAGISDVLDGFAARKLQASSEFGRMLDPIADKILVGIALMMLVARHVLAGLELIPALVILAREILVSGLREFLATVSVSVPVTRIAKFKTVLQMISIGAMILGPSAEKVWPRAIDFAYALLWTAAALTVYTGLAYFRAGLEHLRSVQAAPQSRRGEMA